MSHARDEFYIGYLPQAPPALAAWVRRRVLLVLGLALAAGAALTLGQTDPGSAVYEFGIVRSFEGDLLLEPAPHLVVARPGETEAMPADSRYLLSVFGKTGAGPRLADLGGRRVRLRGSLAHRNGGTMIELADEPVEDLGPAAPSLAEEDLGRVTLRGEIVDSKCHWGVMKPGQGKVHRGCAVRCLSGGVPPLLLIRGADSPLEQVLLAAEDGSSINEALLEWVAEPVEVSGRLARIGDLHVLRTDPATIQSR